MYLFKADLSLLANKSTPDIAQYHLKRTSLPAAFVVGSLVLSREINPCNTIQVWRCAPTNAQKVKSVIIALAGRTVSEGLSENVRLSI